MTDIQLLSGPPRKLRDVVKAYGGTDKLAEAIGCSEAEVFNRLPGGCYDQETYDLRRSHGLFFGDICDKNARNSLMRVETHLKKDEPSGVPTPARLLNTNV